MVFFFYLNCQELGPTPDEYCTADFCGVDSVAPCDGAVTPGDALGVLRAYLQIPDPCQSQND